MKYNLIDHTADFGIHVFGTDVKELFEDAALVLFEQIADIKSLTSVKSHDIEVSGDDLPDLMVNWLREMLAFWTVREQLVKSVTIFSISDHELRARVNTDDYDPDIHFIKNEIKAVTYHDIQVYKGKAGWEARIIFDV